MPPCTPELGLLREHHCLIASKSVYVVGPIDAIHGDHSLVQLPGTLKIPLVEIFKYQQNCPALFFWRPLSLVPMISVTAQSPKLPREGWRGGSQALGALPRSHARGSHLVCCNVLAPGHKPGYPVRASPNATSYCLPYSFILLQRNSNQRMHSSCKTVALCHST